MAWYVDSTGAPVDPGAVVIDGAATVDVYRVTAIRGAVRAAATLWARAGSEVSPERLRVAQADAVGGPSPDPPDIAGGPTANGLDAGEIREVIVGLLVPGEGISITPDPATGLLRIEATPRA